jgi:hypothetical protein
LNLLTPDFKIEYTNMYIEKVSSDNFYIFAGKTTEYDNENIVEEVESSVYDTFYRVYDEIIFAKKIFPTDVAVAIRNITWTAGNVYAQYDDKEKDLDKLDFYAITQQGDDYGIFKCISNNNGAISAVPPLVSQTNPTDEFYKTSDGYIWKLMTIVDRGIVLRHATNKFFPIIRNETIENNAVAGAIEKIVIENPGIGYSTYASGIISQINIGGNSRKLYIQSNDIQLSGIQNFYRDCAIYITSGPAQGQLRKIVDYGFEGNNRFILLETPFTVTAVPSDSFEISPNVTLNGSGTGFQARAIINAESDRIEDIEIIQRGSGYTNATAVIGFNTEVVDPAVFKDAELRVILPPKGGHGFNVQEELFGTFVSNVVDFFDDELPLDDYRQIGIIKNPVLSNIMLTLDTISGLSVDSVLTQGDTTATIKSIDTMTFEITLDPVTGYINPSESINLGETEYSIVSVEKGTVNVDVRTSFDIDLTFGTGFVQGEVIIQENTGATAVVSEFANSNKVFVTNITGRFQVSNVSSIIGQTSASKGIINNINESGIKYGTGEVLFIENTVPITRNSDESEQIKITLGF